MHINPNSGPGGRDNSVMSLGKDVIERKNSLSAYMSHTVNPRLLAKKRRLTSDTLASVDHSSNALLTAVNKLSRSLTIL